MGEENNGFSKVLVLFMLVIVSLALMSVTIYSIVDSHYQNKYAELKSNYQDKLDNQKEDFQRISDSLFKLSISDNKDNSNYENQLYNLRLQLENLRDDNEDLEDDLDKTNSNLLRLIKLFVPSGNY